MEHSRGKKVYVGMSSGVDSSVSAAILKEQGFDVTGVFIKVWQPDFIDCTASDDRLDAMRVTAELGIPFITLDLEKEYKEEVVEYMIREYKAGRTPNPDVMCNRAVKFGGFYDFAMKQGADFVATGHYARKEQIGGGKFELLAGKDSNKDQSYFLWTLTQEKLAHTLFPVGDIEKPEVRALARKFGLYTAEKKDSQGICFLGKISMKEFLKHYIESKRGEVLSESGEVIGHHDGSWFFTIGERHGFTITKKGTDDLPYYIIAKDTEANTITVANRGDIKQELPTTLMIERTNWINETPKVGKTYQARIRYRQPLFDCTIDTVSEDGATITFKLPQPTLAPGQSLVLYSGDICLGGGVLV